jgi:hypothetical protein
MNSAISVVHPLKTSDATETTDAAPAHVDARNIAADKISRRSQAGETVTVAKRRCL